MEVQRREPETALGVLRDASSKTADFGESRARIVHSIAWSSPVRNTSGAELLKSGRQDGFWSVRFRATRRGGGIGLLSYSPRDPGVAPLPRVPLFCADRPARACRPRPAKRGLTMRRIWHLLRLAHEGVSTREIGRVLGIASSTVQDNLGRAGVAGLAQPLPDDLTDDAGRSAVLATRQEGRVPAACRTGGTRGRCKRLSQFYKCGLF